MVTSDIFSPTWGMNLLVPFKLTGDTDYETSLSYEINLQAKDPWGVRGASKLII